MAAGAKILSGLTDNAVRWVESLSRKLGDTTYGSAMASDPETIAGQMGDKLVNLAREVPESFDLFEAKRLYNTMVDANEGFLDLAVTSPKTFREAAYDVPMNSNIRREKYEEKMQDIRDRINAGLPLDDYAELANRNYLDASEFVGHDGRHRERVFEELGMDKSLVKVVPETTSMHNFAAPDELLSKMSPSTELIGQEGNKIGTLGDLFKFLSVMPPAALGALSQLPEETGVE
tara:strand:+ start:424 stop:1122 length:699 start_codon:yes stop_codon:yes gene_type:complete